MNKCNLHTILRLPPGIFYAAGVKTNVLFFERGSKDKGNTKQVWYYDMRTSTENFGKRTPFTRDHFNNFRHAYLSDDRATHDDVRWTSFTRADIKQQGDTLDLGLFADVKPTLATDIPDLTELAIGAIDELEVVVDELKELLRLLKINEK